jgi:MSHA pilin protein MshD
MSLRRRERGVTLVELIVAIAVIGVGVAGILKVMDVTTRSSADPMLVQQAQLIAESYLEEILLKKFVDPDTDTVCPAREASRADYDNVCDYSGLSDNAGAISQLGTAVPGLERYNVSVTVLPNSGSTAAPVLLGSLSNDYGSGYVRVLQVTVVVTHDDSSGVSVTLTGYRTHYNCNSTIAVGQCRPLT